jgi:lipopolysaccharide/colanic/teichoic acid biosynthesis glycosyltransferase
MIAKRIMDIAVSTIVIILSLPIMALVAILVKLDSYGPAIFAQTRIGLDRRQTANIDGREMYGAHERRKEDLGGRPFTMYKFRSMVQEAEELLPCLVNLGALSEPVYKLEDDPRVTRLGGLLRRTSVDELPQLFNVLKGDMSLVGPRPEAMDVVQLYNEDHKKRLHAKPGLTGLQQITCRGTKSMQERLKYDGYYIKHRSMLLDSWILFRTFFVVLGGRGAF